MANPYIILRNKAAEFANSVISPERVHVDWLTPEGNWWHNFVGKIEAAEKCGFETRLTVVQGKVRVDFVKKPISRGHLF
jgi:hypothetical protein